MNQRTNDHQDVFLFEGEGCTLTVRAPGTYRLTAPAHKHFLDVHIGGSKGRYVIAELEQFGEESPANSFVFLPANGERHIRASRSGWSIQLTIDTELLEEVVDELPSIDILGVRTICHAHDEALVGIAASLRDLFTLNNGSTPKKYFAAITMALMARVVFHFSGSVIPKPNGKVLPSRIQKVLDYVEENLDQQLSIAELAEVAGVSAYHFARIFRRATSRSLHQYVVERRLAKAKRLLAEGEDAISQIAYTCGFGSQSHMTNVFTKVLGTTPGKLRSGAS